MPGLHSSYPTEQEPQNHLVPPWNICLSAYLLPPIIIIYDACRLFHPSNPTGSWSLPLSHPVSASVARRLLLSATQQHDMGLCRWPYLTCLAQVRIRSFQATTLQCFKSHRAANTAFFFYRGTHPFSFYGCMYVSSLAQADV